MNTPNLSIGASDRLSSKALVIKGEDGKIETFCKDENPLEVNGILNLEMKIITNVKDRLNRILNINQHNFEVQGNKWLETRLSNIESFVIYIEGAKDFKFDNVEMIEIFALGKKIIDRVLKPLSEEVKKLGETRFFNSSQENSKKIENLIKRLEVGIPRKS